MGPGRKEMVCGSKETSHGCNETGPGRKKLGFR